MASLVCCSSLTTAISSFPLVSKYYLRRLRRGSCKRVLASRGVESNIGMVGGRNLAKKFFYVLASWRTSTLIIEMGCQCVKRFEEPQSHIYECEFGVEIQMGAVETEISVSTIAEVSKRRKS